MTNYYKSSDNLDLAYLDEGEGLPLVMLAGLTRNAHDFDHVVPHLPGVRIIRPDYRGRGQSAYAPPETYTIPTETNDILRLLDHLEIDRAAVLGTSRGGLIGMSMAAIAKDRLLGLCLNDIGPEIDANGLAAIEQYLGRRPTQKSYEDAAKARAALLIDFHNVPYSRWLAEVRAHYRETENGLELRYDPKLRDAFLAASDAPMPDLWPLFDALEGLPLALLRGENSNILSKETAEKMYAKRPDMSYAEVTDRGHVPFLDEPESLSALRVWLKELQ
ncbi:MULTISPECIES: alpha/beta fold hydrolase [Halocynthiibacter]|uniref:Alpha/beta hydrolase n=1 Tax=Halocynthiibacter halioticoli TaxID=2986804 RepID=A0AAE3J2A2_9RHOB|nr:MULTISPECIES: alpha/beta hydrolase [Halocynthiibacter]MCV6825338.1 alpha/beta hydrolase [Halocynthiibacter halioticoli]MCW4058339.1 alpha/beta hydrolase [Halocynthiibacter sp. SDUM655004]